MIYWTYNGERLSRKTWVDSDGTKHPPNWDIWPDEEKIARGLVRVEEPDPVPPEPTYEDLRRRAYGPVGDQLDMQWHDLVDGTTTWKDHVAAVKAAHPKPE